MKKTAVVILNWNGKKFLEKFLPSVIEHSSNVADIVIADNASTDDSITFLKNTYPQLSIIQNEQNGGFAKGYNDALKQIDAEYYVLLNSDIEVTPHWIEPVIELMDSDQNIAACQPKLRSYYEKEKFEYAGGAGGFIDKYGYPFCRGRIFDTLETDNGQYNDTCEIFWATGACMFVKASIYHRLGGLDEDFFAHMEEIDLCWRMKNKGYKIMYCAGSTVYHVGGGTLPKSSPFKTYLNFRNNIALLYKNLPKGKLISVFALRFPLDGIAAVKFMLDGSFQDLWAVARAHFYFYKHHKTIKRKRKMLVQQKVSCVYDQLLLIPYYLKKKKVFNQLDKRKFQ